MLKKYGVQQLQTYEVVVPVFGKLDDYIVKGSNLSLSEAKELQDKYPNAIIRPE